MFGFANAAAIQPWYGKALGLSNAAAMPLQVPRFEDHGAAATSGSPKTLVGLTR